MLPFCFTMLELKYIPLAEAKPFEGNPKRHDVERLKDSMRRYGYADPVIINQANGMLLAGHGRIAALSEMREAGDPPPRNVQSKDGEWFVPAIISGMALEGEEHAAFLLDANLSTMSGIPLHHQMEAFWDEQAAGLLAHLYEAEAAPIFVEDEDLHEVLTRLLDQESEVAEEGEAAFAVPDEN